MKIILPLKLDKIISILLPIIMNLRCFCFTFLYSTGHLELQYFFFFLALLVFVYPPINSKVKKALSIFIYPQIPNFFFLKKGKKKKRIFCRVLDSAVHERPCVPKSKTISRPKLDFIVHIL